MSHRDAAFEAFYADLKASGVDVRDRDLMRVSWDAGRRYEAERIDGLTRSLFDGPRKPRTSPGLKTRR